MKTFLVIAAAAGAPAVGVPAAIAATDPAEQRQTPAQTTQPVQQEQERPQRDDCPEKDGTARSSAEF